MSVLSKILKDAWGGTSARQAVDALAPTKTLHELLESGHASLQAGDVQAAQDLCAAALTSDPDEPAVHELLARIEFAQCLAAAQARFPGPTYLDWLQWFHDRFAPATYVEIGVESGQSLQYAKPPTRAVGIDPALRIVHSQMTWVKLFQLPSDEFFQAHDLRQVLGMDTVGLAFIDGLHTFDQALKDFMNVERYADKGTVVLFHDILPVIPKTAERERATTFWVGDTWKVMTILKRHRPDLTLFTIPAYPSGLGVVLGLNPGEQLLWQSFDAICREAMAETLQNYSPQIDDHLNLVPNQFDAVADLLARSRTRV